jgi:hypothetical protein
MGERLVAMMVSGVNALLGRRRCNASTTSVFNAKPAHASAVPKACNCLTHHARGSQRRKSAVRQMQLKALRKTKFAFEMRLLSVLAFKVSKLEYMRIAARGFAMARLR